MAGQIQRGGLLDVDRPHLQPEGSDSPVVGARPNLPWNMGNGCLSSPLSTCGLAVARIAIAPGMVPSDRYTCDPVLGRTRLAPASAYNSVARYRCRIILVASGNKCSSCVFFFKRRSRLGPGFE